MRIPLDYYRILGLPIQATAEQLQQAHRDRALQLPRREYSEAAIAARKQLLDEAYAVLSDPDQRQAYDANFLAKTYELEPDRPGTSSTTTPAESTDTSSDPYTPSVDIHDDQLVGALLILLELGEYELVLKLGRTYLGNNSSLKNGRFGEPDIVFADIILTVALACLELGREQWQQGQYENAAESLEAGQELLLREGLFATVRGEVQTDLYKLRPYRVLELLALPEESTTERRQGLRLLREMLQERGGIDGTGTDQSGLNVDDFLRFIQQLRGYLSAAEQQTLFEEEARRPSAVATYLAVYALLAQGFAQCEPALIRRAKLMLVRLGSRQDVHLEQAVCALLLGQTEEASRALELSHDYEPLAFIRENSQGSPDLLPGLCLYSERWLQEEVFPHFRDLAQQQVSLKDYFANEQVQAYLEELPNESPNSNGWAGSSKVETNGQSSSTRNVGQFSNGREVGSYPQPPAAATRLQQSVESEPRVAPTTRAVTTVSQLGQVGAEHTTPVPSNSVPVTPPSSQRPASGIVTRDGNAHNSLRPAALDHSGPPPRERSRGQVANGLRVPDPEDLPPRRGGEATSTSAKKSKPILLFVLGLLGLAALGYLTTKAFGWATGALQDSRGPKLEANQPMISLDRPLIAVPDPEDTAQAAAGPLTKEAAQTVVQTWLSAKAAALGPNHATTQLNQILTDGALAQWQQQAEDDKGSNSHREYQHAIRSIDAVEMSDVDPNQARIDAEVSEAAAFYVNGQLDRSLSYPSETIRVRYNLVRRDGRWLIREMDVQ
ncbi:IMS domain-containing protein [Trichocoleus sp. FACHB-262]|uniref:IMS domain-containing protein n=1 Tax=Trichocoleus sp. FACHB-262 TaxID=2692869 RepID=UPI001683707E|nr:IMS domain-containing protein [Trichocoleus sp. FACHB-262]MBD2121199.1 DUF4101 domain-containing protein [Trichocoleus sp. FACHB-262]